MLAKVSSHTLITYHWNMIAETEEGLRTKLRLFVNFRNRES